MEISLSGEGAARVKKKVYMMMVMCAVETVALTKTLAAELKVVRFSLGVTRSIRGTAQAEQVGDNVRD